MIGVHATRLFATPRFLAISGRKSEFLRLVNTSEKPTAQILQTHVRTGVSLEEPIQILYFQRIPY
jgi:hypothetical protein